MDTGKLIDSMKRVVKSELGSYDTTATVKRVEGSTAWVHIPGGVDETPVRLTMNAKEGDNVQVRVSDGKAFLAGNVSAPPTDDTTAEAAKALANRAAEDAGRAKTAADVAESYATSAQASAAQSANILEGMEQAAIAAGTTLDGIYADAAEAKATTDEINDYADTAGKTVTQILDDGETAGAAAQAASEAANSALVGLSTVEDVVGVLNWITEHGTMTLTSDVTVNPAHVYFVVDPAGDYVVGGTHYSIVSEPDDADISTYYELSVDESVENYVATHVAVDAEGLWIIPDAGGNKVLIATGSGSTYTTAGTYIVGKVGGVDTVFAKFLSSGATMQAESGTVIAHLGYGPGKNSAGGTSNAPYYTLGVRRPSSAVGNYSLSQGNNTVANGYVSVSEGYNTNSSGEASHAEGYASNYQSDGSVGIVASGRGAYAGGSTQGDNFSLIEGTSLIKSAGIGSHANGFVITDNTNSTNPYGTILASNYGSHAEGCIETDASGQTYIQATGKGAHAEGYVVDGEKTSAEGNGAHAEGGATNAVGNYSHAEGYSTYASQAYTHAQNLGTVTSISAQTVIGKYNDYSSLSSVEHAFEIGNGTADNARSNALTVDWSGNVEAAGGGTFGDDVSVTGNVTATGDVTDGGGNTLSSIAAHAVISTGSTGGWNYKKYADGTFEATRFSTSGATGAMTQVGSTGIYYSSAAEITFPSIGITGITSCLASVMPSSNYLMSYYMSRLTTAHVYFSYIRYGSGSAVTGISYGISITGTYS